MLNVLDAVPRLAKRPLERLLPLDQWLAPNIVTREKKIGGQRHGFLIDLAMQSVEVRNAIGRQMNNLGVNNQRLTQERRFLHNARIAFGPVVSVHRIQTHATIADVYLQPVAVMLQLVQPTRTGGWPLGDHRLTRMNESSGRV